MPRNLVPTNPNLVGLKNKSLFRLASAVSNLANTWHQEYEKWNGDPEFQEELETALRTLLEEEYLV